MECFQVLTYYSHIEPSQPSASLFSQQSMQGFAPFPVIPTYSALSLTHPATTPLATIISPPNLSNLVIDDVFAVFIGSCFLVDK